MKCIVKYLSVPNACTDILSIGFAIKQRTLSRCDETVGWRPKPVRKDRAQTFLDVYLPTLVASADMRNFFGDGERIGHRERLAAADLGSHVLQNIKKLCFRVSVIELQPIAEIEPSQERIFLKCF